MVTECNARGVELIVYITIYRVLHSPNRTKLTRATQKNRSKTITHLCMMLEKDIIIIIIMNVNLLLCWLFALSCFDVAKLKCNSYLGLFHSSIIATMHKCAFHWCHIFGKHLRPLVALVVDVVILQFVIPSVLVCPSHLSPVFTLPVWETQKLSSIKWPILSDIRFREVSNPNTKHHSTTSQVIYFVHLYGFLLYYSLICKGASSCVIINL